MENRQTLIKTVKKNALSYQKFVQQFLHKNWLFQSMAKNLIVRCYLICVKIYRKQKN